MIKQTTRLLALAAFLRRGLTGYRRPFEGIRGLVRGEVAMTYKTCVSLIGTTLLCAWAVDAARADEREMNVRQGPDTIFDRPVTEIMAELSDAEATGENGRVGNELVFWGYELADGRQAFFFACAMIPSIDCDERRRSVCLGDATLIRSAQARGKVRHVVCRPVTVVGVGDLRPGCTSTDSASDLAVGLVQCN